MARLTRRAFQRKAIATGFGIFLTGSLAATGFAAWAIASSASETVFGDVRVFVVRDDPITIRLIPFNEVNTGIIQFEPKKEDVKGRIRNDGANFENLQFTIAGTVRPYEYVANFTIRLDIALTDANGNLIMDGNNRPKIDSEAEARFEAAADEEAERPYGISGSYIKLPECWRKDVPLAAYPATGEASFSYVVAFGWGTAFAPLDYETQELLAPENPGEFFERKDPETDEFLVPDGDMVGIMYDFYKTLTGRSGMPASVEISDGVTQVEQENGYTRAHYLVTIVADTSIRESSSSESSVSEPESSALVGWEVF